MFVINFCFLIQQPCARKLFLACGEHVRFDPSGEYRGKPKAATENPLFV